MSTALDKILDKFEANTLRFREIQIGRTFIAGAQLLTIALTKPSNLFAPQSGVPAFPHCEGTVQKLSVYCIPHMDQSLATVLLGAIFVWVISGYRPRYSAVFHWWASLSVGVSWSLPDGGEAIARIITLLLIPVCLAYPYASGWSASRLRPISANLNILSFVFLWSIRAEMAFIYFDASISKFGVPEWVDGSAMYYIARGSMFGVSGPLAAPYLWITRIPAGVIFITWSALLIEILIAVFILFSDNKYCRRAAITSDILLHAGIGILMGIWSFSLIMIGASIASCAPFRARGTTADANLHLRIERPTEADRSLSEPYAEIH